MVRLTDSWCSVEFSNKRIKAMFKKLLSFLFLKTKNIVKLNEKGPKLICMFSVELKIFFSSIIYVNGSFTIGFLRLTANWRRYYFSGIDCHLWMSYVHPSNDKNYKLLHYISYLKYQYRLFGAIMKYWISICKMTPCILRIMTCIYRNQNIYSIRRCDTMKKYVALR